MTNSISVKICGLATVDDVCACADAGANYMGLVFFEKSPRNITITAARELALAARLGLAKVNSRAAGMVILRGDFSKNTKPI